MRNEYFLWRNQRCDNANKFWSITILFILYLQPIVSTLVASKLYPNTFLQSDVLYLFMIIYSLMIFYCIFYLSKKDTYVCSKPQNSKRLEWNALTKVFNDKTVLFTSCTVLYAMFFTIIAIVYLWQNNRRFTYPLRELFVPITLLLIIFAQTKNYNYYYNIFRPDIYGSFWCFISVFLGPVSLTYL